MCVGNTLYSEVRVCFTCATFPVFFRWFWSSLVAPSWKVLGRAASSMVNSGVLSWNNEISTDWAACNTHTHTMHPSQLERVVTVCVFPWFKKVPFLSSNLSINCGIGCFDSCSMFVRQHLSDVRALGFSRPGDDAGDGQPSLTGVHKVWSFHL